jgi:hypothetical protein
MSDTEVLKLQIKVLQDQVFLLTQELRAIQSVVRADSLRIRNVEQSVSRQSSGVGFGSGQGYESPR